MRTIKDTKGIHNRIRHGSWSRYGTKEERKERRKLFKRVRHKLLMHIPLNEQEESFRNQWQIDEKTKMDCRGLPCIYGKYCC